MRRRARAMAETKAAVAYLRNYLQGFTTHFTAARSFEALLAGEGVTYQPPAVPRPKRFRKMHAGGCFTNSFRAAQSKGWTYVEGYALIVDPVFPIHHAWCLDAEGGVV